MGENSPIADPHGFNKLYDGKFLCEKEPGKEVDLNFRGETQPVDEFGRRTIWIGMPEGRAGSNETRSHDLIGEFGNNIPTAHASQWYEEQRITPGFIAAIGMELKTHDNQGVLVFTEDECSVCMETPLDLVMKSVGCCNHRVLCSDCADILNSNLEPCPICRAPNALIQKH